MSVYNKFAHVYDQIEHDAFSKKMFNYSQRILNKLRYRPKSVLDLACGTGTVAVMWAKNNVTTFGIDGSADMLEQAQRKAKKERVKIDFSRQMLTSFSLPRQVDLITCFFDSLNYLLTTEDLTRALKRSQQALYPGGYMIFDLNTPEAMKVLWGDQTYAEEKDDIAWIWKNFYYPKAKTAEVKATFFVKQGKIWERFDEIHAERGYTATEIKKAVRDSGLKLIKMYDCLKFTKPARDSFRIAVIAQKSR